MSISHFWMQGDFISHAVALLLAALSLFCWIVIFDRFFRQLRMNRDIGAAVEAFWSAADLSSALTAIATKDRSGLFSGMAGTAARTAEQHGQAVETRQGMAAGVTLSETITRALRNHITHSQARLESGLTFLASIGSTAPFIGLFGTVWGIYHALVGLSGATQVVLGKVAGPVGEALIMTAAGLFVAIPAVLAYNALTRANRLTLAYLDGFAHDLHAYFTTGARAAKAG
jgi:biopolymer transport protein ExbB